jgi:hypothetical protein
MRILWGGAPGEYECKRLWIRALTACQPALAARGLEPAAYQSGKLGDNEPEEGQRFVTATCTSEHAHRLELLWASSQRSS